MAVILRPRVRTGSQPRCLWQYIQFQTLMEIQKLLFYLLVTQVGLISGRKRQGKKEGYASIPHAWPLRLMVRM